MKKRTATGVGVLLFFLLPAGLLATARAADPPAELPELRLSLRDAIQAALNHNPSVRLLKEQIHQAQGTAQTHRGRLLPTISAFVNQRNQTLNLGTLGIRDRAGVVGPFDIFDARVTLVQTLFSLSLIRQWQAAKAGVEVAELTSEVTRRDTMALVGLLYMEALRAEAAVKAVEANVELSRQLWQLAQNRKAAGMATRLDVTRAQVQVENEKQRLLLAQNQRDRAKLNLIRALGIDFGVRVVLTDQLSLVDVPLQAPDEALLTAKHHRTELKTQAMREKLAALSLKAVSTEVFPALSVNGDYGYIGGSLDEALATRSIGATLSVPIFDGAQRHGRLAQTRSQARQEAIRTQDITDQITLEVRDALLTVTSARSQVEVSEEGLRLALLELELARERFDAGLANNIEVTSAQTSVARARDNVVEALFTFNAARINLARAQGQLETLY